MGAHYHRSNGVAVIGFPYVRESFFAVFRHWPEPDHIRFLLPRRWPIKGGKIVYVPPTDARITTAAAYFSDYHSHYPVVGGLLKGLMPAFPLFLWRYRKSVDIVYACSEPILLVTLYYALWTKLLGKRLVLFTWENISYEKKFRGFSRLVHGLLRRLNLWLADGLMCGNQAGAEIHRQLTGTPITVIPMNGLDPEQFSRTANPRVPALTARVVYAFVGALGERKGVHLMLQALPDVLRTIPNAHLVIAGSGEYEGEIDRFMREPSIRDHVTRLPWISHHEMIRLLSAADVFVYPSMPHKGWAEQFGYAMAEASLLELPVISTRSGSIPDVVVDGTTGILVKPGDVTTLTRAMVQLGADADLRQQMGIAGRRYIIDRYSNEAIARNMYDFFTLL